MIEQPRLDQGNFSRTTQFNRRLKFSLFEGWYHKVYIPDLHLTVIVIFGFMEYKSHKQAFIQVASSNDLFSNTYYYPVEELIIAPNKITLAKHFFSADVLEIDLPDFAISIQGRTKESSPLSPFQSAIGLKKFIPFVNCKHEVLVTQHPVNVALKLRGIPYSGIATHYLETSWGNSFPEEYYWLQANSFDVPNTSFLFALGKPRFLGIKSQQFLGYFKTEKEEFLFNTGNTKAKLDFQSKTILLKQKKQFFEISYSSGSPLSLLAPHKGQLNHPIIEHLNAPIKIRLINNKERFEFNSNAASWEHQ